MFLWVQKLLASPVRGELTQLFMKTEKIKKTKYLKIRISDDELIKLKNLSQDYPSLSSYVLDACWHFNGKRHLKKIEFLSEKYQLIVDLRSDLNRLAANLNQLVQYTNSCIKMGIYLDNTSSEVLRIQNELLNCLLEYKSKSNLLENELKHLSKFI